MSTDSTTSAAYHAKWPDHFPSSWSLADLQLHLGKIPLHRIRLVPPPGYATEEDVVKIQGTEGRLCEMHDGTLVEKAMGWYESLLAGLILSRLNAFLQQQQLGKVLGADGALEILPGRVLIPDVSFISWDRWPQVAPTRRPIPAIVPDLVIEVLSQTNSAAEMAEKLNCYLQAGVRLVWYIDPDSRTARSHAEDGTLMEVPLEGILEGGPILPGFELSLSTLFEEADLQRPSSS